MTLFPNAITAAEPVRGWSAHTTSRPFAGETDFWRIRDLLITTYPLTPICFNWEIRRWDGWRFHREMTEITPEWSERIQLWENDAGELIGVAHPEYYGDVHFELDPDYRHLEAEMLAWAEVNLSVPAPESPEGKPQRQVDIFVWEYNAPRIHLLQRFGYEKTLYGGMVRRMRFGRKPLPTPVLPMGYRVRGTQPLDSDYERCAAILNAGFHRTTHTALEYRNFATLSPSFDHDLNLVVEVADGAFAAHVGFTVDVVNKRAIVEPVCTHPDHRRLGLARALILEGCRRVHAMGMTDVYVDTGDMIAANALYDHVGFTEAYKGYMWQKRMLA